MSDFNEHLEAIGSELAGLLKLEVIEPEAVTMSPEQFLAYAAEQIDLAKADEDPAPRLEALHELVELAKAYSWEDSGGMSVSVYSGPLSVKAGSRQAEKIAEHPGKGLGVDQKAAPASGAFESASGPTGPASAAARPAARHMPPAFPQSEAAAGAEGWMAKAADLLKGVNGADALLAEFHEMLKEGAEAEGEPSDKAESVEAEAPAEPKWPADLSTAAFLDGKASDAEADEDFGADPEGLGRGKVVNG